MVAKIKSLFDKAKPHLPLGALAGVIAVGTTEFIVRRRARNGNEEH